ncbi:MAG: glycosyltransferase family 1 protein [Alphaproteobacteria bacterium]|nr:glycosyltransferase family 1 protein [Alphaproteobacteria bacterium]
MKILVISDAWKPQVNGVVRTYECLATEMPTLGHDFHVIGPADFPWRVPMPFYREIELAIAPARRLARLVDEYAPDTIHIATEGPLGKAARALCAKRSWPFTTCYHTQFPDYAAKRAAKIIPALYKPVRRYTTNMLKKFHAPSKAMMVATATLEAELKTEGYTAPMRAWARGVYVDVFHPGPQNLFAALPRPVALYVGRVAIEKNIEAFLDMAWDGSKVIVGDGPSLPELRARYPQAVFAGKQFGTVLADHYRSADVFVFPSRTDTFGMVMPEALACGLPVAAYDVTGPRDIITAPFLGCIGDDLAASARTALTRGSADERFQHARTHYAWPAIARAFVDIINDSGAVIAR